MIYIVEKPVIPAGCFGTFEHSEARLEDLQAVLAGKVGKFVAYISGEVGAAVEELTGVIVEEEYLTPKLQPGDLQLCLDFKYASNPVGLWRVKSWKFSWLRYVSTETGESP